MLEFVNRAATTEQECFEIWRYFVLQLLEDKSFSLDYVAEMLQTVMQDIHDLQTAENSLAAVHYQALAAICEQLRSGALKRSDSDVSFRKLHMGAMAFMKVFTLIMVQRPKQKEFSGSMDALQFHQNIIDQKTQQLEALGGVVAAYEEQAIMLHLERSAQFAWHMQHKAGLQENIKSMTATIKQLEERNMFLERRHQNCTDKLEELLREQRQTE
jgi:hypothetical protein